MGEWSSMLFVFENHSKLQNYLTENYINLNDHVINIKGLLEVSRPWSRSEKFMLNFALHIYCNYEKIDLNEIDCLDSTNKDIVFKAMKVRFK